MDISSINAGYLPAAQDSRQGAGADAKLQSLKQKLQQLNTEREQAIQRGDTTKKEKIEKEIKEVERQIEQLEQQAQKENSGSQGRSSRPATDKYIPEAEWNTAAHC